MSPFIETIRIEAGVIHHLPYHNARMNQTRRELLGADIPLDLAHYIQPPVGAGRTKCRVEYAAEIGQVSYAPYEIRPVRGLALVRCDGMDYRYKSTDRARLDELFRARGACDDILIVRDGLLTDTSICNIALWDGQAWLTPARPLLRGTMRAALLDAGRLVEADIRAADMHKYPRIRLFNAMIGFGELEIANEGVSGL